MFEFFTEKAIKVMLLAQEEGRRSGHNTLGTEQILLGMLAEGTCVAAKVLDSVGVKLEDVRARVEAIVGRNAEPSASDVPFTPGARILLELSWNAAAGLGHNYIASEHLLLGLCREGDDVAARVLRECGVDLDGLQEEVLKVLTDAGSLPMLGVVENKCTVPRWSRRELAEPVDIEPIMAKLSADAQAAYDSAVAEARLFKCSILGTEQLLVGLAVCSNSKAASVMQQMGINEDTIRAEFERIGEYGTAGNDLTMPEPSLRVKLSLACAEVEAKECGHDEIDTTHLLVGLLDQDGGVAFHIMQNLGVDVFVLRAKLIAVMKSDQKV